MYIVCVHAGTHACMPAVILACVHMFVCVFVCVRARMPADHLCTRASAYGSRHYSVSVRCSTI